MTKITVDKALIEQAIAAIPEWIGVSRFALRQELRAALAEPAVEPVAEVVDYILQDDIHNRLTPRVVDIAYSAFMRGRSGINSDDGGPCDWFNDTKPTVMKQIAKVKKDLAKAAAPVREPVPEPVTTLVDADDECDVTALIARLDSLFARITPPPYFAAADGRGVGLGGKRWNGNGGFQSVMKPNVAKHGGSHFANIAFLAEITSAWPTLREFIHRRAAPVREPAPVQEQQFTADELDLMRQWFESMQDTNRSFVIDADKKLHQKIIAAIQAAPRAEQPRKAVKLSASEARGVAVDHFPIYTDRVVKLVRAVEQAVWAKLGVTE